MRGSLRLTTIFGIDIEIHVTFFLLLLLFFFILGPKGVLLILGVFFFVTVHELSHSLAARHFGIKVKRITLLPIGGVASMAEIPSNPYQELIIALAGPLSNVAVLVVFFFPLYWLLGKETLMFPLLAIIGKVEFTRHFNVLAYIYWLNLVLAVFNMLPSFPMDGGRVLRALLTLRMSYKKATAIAVRMGHIFALFFGYIGIVHGHIFLIIIAIFLYMSASSEGMQVNIRETIKRYTVQNILAREFVHVSPDMPLSKVLELVFHTHQDDYPVMENEKLVGFLTRKGLIHGIHARGKEAKVSEIMRTDIPPVKVKARLHDVQRSMQKYATSAMPVERAGRIVGVVTIDDINRIYLIISER